MLPNRRDTVLNIIGPGVVRYYNYERMRVSTIFTVPQKKRRDRLSKSP